jgi:CheY-like chemotaxis protein
VATRKTNFEVVPLSAIAPLLAAEGTIPAIRARKILSVSQDVNLAMTREMLLVASGYSVSTALNSEDAVRRCESGSFDLIMIGHSMPFDQKKRLLRELRKRCSTPILGLYRPGESPMKEADYLFDATESPALLLEAVRDIFRTPDTAD